MPLYQCLVPAGSLDADTRATLAEAITTVHASVISVPRIFVNVVFIEYEPTAYFTGGRPNTVSSITATFRAGFDSALRSELPTRLCESWSSITGQDARRIMVSLDEVDASSRMENGMLMPSFGDEASWARSHAQELGELGWRD
jgi:phenylpyruvate tautomerase PptA (4-oxalocrotonate tautomerase family)